jgi:outer membrane protein assembly factor BamE (lipoprotein component of BamABCDE complex)
MRKAKFATLVLALLSVIGCQTTETVAPLRQTTTDPAPRVVDVRKMRATLPGKTMPQVLKTIGKPATVYTIDEREYWQYEDAARDSITGQPIKHLEIVFRNRIVESVNFSID